MAKILFIPSSLTSGSSNFTIGNKTFSGSNAKALYWRFFKCNPLNLNWLLSYPVNHIVNINLLVMELVTFFYIKPANSIIIHNKIYQTI